MRPIGGELESSFIKEDIYFTDSGRSSLRLFFKSDFLDKKVLLPNYFCEVIEKILKDEGIQYEFYNILDDLTLDINSIKSKKFDVLYIINYFGMIQNVKDLELAETIIIEDNVFSFDFNNHANYQQWYGFNSFRKISSLSDGSLVKTNLDIKDTLIVQKEADFVQLKNEAKEIKYNFINDYMGNENDYLNKFERAESILDKQSAIYSISNKSMYKLLNYKKEDSQNILKKRYERLEEIFYTHTLDLQPLNYSFFILKLSTRDLLREYLMSKGIFLPIHWPQSSQENDLYKSLISIPLFINYTDKEFEYIIDTIKDFFNEKHK